MSKRRRYTVRMDDSEAAVVAPLEGWAGLESLFEDLAEEVPEHREGWLEWRDHVRSWVEKTKDRKPDEEFQRQGGKR